MLRLNRRRQSVSHAFVLAPAAPPQFSAVVALLQEAGLPTSDLCVDAIGNFLVATDDSGLAGAAALERHGDVGLLRSVVVAGNRRGAGIGAALVAALERRARDAHLDSLVLLTETAGDYFQRLGYVAAPRADAPAAIQASTEFAAVCPASAVFMHKAVR